MNEQVIEATGEKVIAELRYALMNIRSPFRTTDEILFYANKVETHTEALVSELEQVKAEKGKVGAVNKVLREGADHALQLLRESHIQNNKYRMGAFGSADLDSAIERLAEALAAIADAEKTEKGE